MCPGIVLRYFVRLRLQPCSNAALDRRNATLLAFIFNKTIGSCGLEESSLDFVHGSGSRSNPTCDAEGGGVERVIAAAFSGAAHFRDLVFDRGADIRMVRPSVTRMVFVALVMPIDERKSEPLSGCALKFRMNAPERRSPVLGRMLQNLGISGRKIFLHEYSGGESSAGGFEIIRRNSRGLATVFPPYYLSTWMYARRKHGLTAR